MKSILAIRTRLVGNGSRKWKRMTDGDIASMLYLLFISFAYDDA